MVTSEEAHYSLGDFGIEKEAQGDPGETHEEGKEYEGDYEDNHDVLGASFRAFVERFAESRVYDEDQAQLLDYAEFRLVGFGEFDHGWEEVL